MFTPIRLEKKTELYFLHLHGWYSSPTPCMRYVLKNGTTRNIDFRHTMETTMVDTYVRFVSVSGRKKL